MQTIRSINLQKNLGDVLRAADVEAVVVMNRDQPRTVVMSADEYIRLKIAAGEPVPPEVRKSRPTLHQRHEDVLAYDPTEPGIFQKVAQAALANRDEDEERIEIQNALKRWSMS